MKPTEEIPDCLPSRPQNSELLDRFSQEVGSATSASGWIMPNFIIHHVVECPYASSTSQSPKSNNDGFEGPFLYLRGGNMDDFDECDPNSPTALERYTSWINPDHYDEQYALRQGTQNTQQTQQVSSHIVPRFNPRITPRAPQQVPTQYDSDSWFYPQVPHPPPSVDDSDDDKEEDEFTNHGHGRLVSSPGSRTESSSGSSMRSGSVDYHEQTTVRPHCARDDSYVIRCYAPDSPMATGLNGSEYDADSEASESMWNSNRSILQGSDLPDYEEVENRDSTWNPNSIGSSVNQVTESDFWSISTDSRYLISRFLGFFDVPDSPTTVGSVHDGCALPEPIDVLAEQSLFSPTSVYGDAAYSQHDMVPAEQHPFSPSSPAARNPFSPDFAWPPAPSGSIAQVLQCPRAPNPRPREGLTRPPSGHLARPRFHRS